MPFLLGTAEGAFIIALITLLASRQFVFAFGVVILLVVLFLVSRAFLNGRLFPHVDIQLSKKSGLVTREIITVVLVAISTICTVAGLIWQIIHQGRP